jgi:hypothetical protein
MHRIAGADLFGTSKRMGDAATEGGAGVLRPVVPGQVPGAVPTAPAQAQQPAPLPPPPVEKAEGISPAVATVGILAVIGGILWAAN